MSTVQDAIDANDVVVLEWTYTPADYFEQRIVVERNDYIMTIDDGSADAKIHPAEYDGQPNMRDKLHAALNDRFLGVQLLSHKIYELSGASKYHFHPDGRKDTTVFPEGVALTLAVGTPDIVVRDKNGEIVTDSRQDRIEKKKELADLVETYRSQDQVVASMLASYQAAVIDPDNELVHLYEIRDALSSKFSSDGAARQELGISTKEWSRLGKIANYDPLRQGRHRGKSVGELRDATHTELNEARNIARTMIEAYLYFLDVPV